MRFTWPSHIHASGCGLVGLSAWRAGANSVCLTDLDENLDRLRQIVAANGASPQQVRVEALGKAIVAGLQDPSVSGVQRYDKMEALAEQL